MKVKPRANAASSTTFHRFGWRRLGLLVLAMGSIGAFCGLGGLGRHGGTDRVYRIGVGDDPPLHAMRPGGGPEGLAVDLISEAARRGRIRLEWVYAPEGPDAALMSHRVDLWPMLTILPAREGRVHISAPWLNNEYLLVSRKTLDPDPSKRALAILDLAVNHRIAAQYSPARLVPSATRKEALQAVCTDRADAFLESKRGLVDLLLTRPPECEAASFQVTPVPNSRTKLGVGATLESSLIADELRAQVSDIAIDGTLDALFRKWNLLSSADTETIYQLLDSQRRESAVTRVAAILAVVLIAVAAQVFRVRQKQHFADRANRLKSEFLANMSHEIRTPMNGIIGMTQLSLGMAENEEQKEYLEAVASSARSLLALLNDILDFSRIEAGKLTIELSSFHPRQLLTEVVQLIEVDAHAKGLEVRMECAPEVPARIVGDPLRLRQILVNLLGNAVKFTERGSVEARITIDAQRKRLRFAVRDTGIGIPLDKQRAVFAAFTQADGSITRKYGGSGLGLAISSKLIRLMGGTIRVESEPGHGTLFEVDAPYQDQGTPEHLQEEEEVVVKAAPFMPRRILIAEDNPVNQKVATRLLEKSGHSVAVVSNGKEALAAIEREAFDVVLMDVQMPVMDGFEASARIRAREANDGGHIPILAMTAHAMCGDRERCLAAGMDGYISKPVRLPELLQAIAGVTGNKVAVVAFR